MEDKIIEQNEMIARFMGFRVEDGWVKFDDAFSSEMDSSNLKYHESHDKLMPVIVKCHNIRNQDDNIFDLYSGFVLDETPIWVPIEKVYERVVAFIKEYNEHEKA